MNELERQLANRCPLCYGPMEPGLLACRSCFDRVMAGVISQRSTRMTNRDWHLPVTDDLDWNEPLPQNPPRTKIMDTLEKLHRIKSKAYGPSWRAHGELFSIIPNIVRKTDRIARKTETPDEHRIDTVADLAVYCILYRAWLREHDSYSQILDRDEPLVFHVARVEVEMRVQDLNSPNDQDNFEQQMAIEARELMRIVPEDPKLQSAELYRQRASSARDLAALAVMWLIIEYREHPEEYAAWASQWNG